ncbi:MAG: hypothetical protein J1F41_09055 [Lachnospiraceae bacterium]|nr:hypothetical protein [Lachnospiraceae bacterium]
MRISGFGSMYTAYVYNPNVVGANSMNKLSKIPDDVLAKKTDYSETVAKEENQNPLKKGQTIDFENVLARQMQQGQNRAAKILPNGIAPVEQKAEEEATQVTAKKQSENTMPAVAAVEANGAENATGAAFDNNSPNMQMQRAIQAYEMFMTA